MKVNKISRRAFLLGLGAVSTAALLSACGGSASSSSAASGSAASGSAAAAGSDVFRTLDEIKADGTVNIGVFSDKNPFGYVDENGEYQGYDVYFARRLAEDLGVEANFVSTEAANRIEYLQTGKVDIILANFTVTPERAEELRELYSGDGASTVSIQLDGDAMALTVYDLKSGYISFPDSDYNMVELPEDGAYICARIERDYDVHIGDELEFSPYGTDDTYTVRVRGVVCSMTEGIVMSRTAAEKIGIDYHCNTIYTAQTDIASDEAVTGVQSKQSIIDSFDIFMAIMNFMIALLCGGAVLLGVIVLYNLGTMSYTERYREMATLKVLGFRDKRIGLLLIQQNLALTVIGIIIGLPAGYYLLRELIVLLASEYELSLVISPLSYFITVVITVGMSLLVGLLISRKNKKIDMVEALKAAD